MACLHLHRCLYHCLLPMMQLPLASRLSVSPVVRVSNICKGPQAPGGSWRHRRYLFTTKPPSPLCLSRLGVCSVGDAMADTKPSYYHRPGKRVPAERPPFTVGDLRKAIPAHCWERSLVKSFAYLALDLAMIAGLYWASTFIWTAPVPTWAKWGLLWPLYWFFQGAVATGVWVTVSCLGLAAWLLVRLLPGSRGQWWQPCGNPPPTLVHPCCIVH